jgi:tellurite resistance protein
MVPMQVDLTRFGAERLASAVQFVIQNASAAAYPLPDPSRLQQGAKATLESTDADGSAYFQSILELGYLVASADGFANEERQALSLLLEGVMGSAVSHDVLELHFKDLDEACEMLGRRERLRRAAEDFAQGASRSEALGFAALVAMADGMLAQPEADALAELGTFLGFSPQQVADVVQGVSGALLARLES